MLAGAGESALARASAQGRLHKYSHCQPLNKGPQMHE